MTTFNIRIEGEFTLSPDEIWPGGDAPANPTAEDVRDALESCGGRRRTLDEWELLDDLSVTVYGPRDHAEVWP